jgi:hypothetical protein
MRSMPNRLTLAAGAMLGVIVFERSLGFHVLDPSAVAWMFHGGIDPSGHFLGWHLFRHDAWWLPPGAVMAFGYPIGTSVALTDSIPLVAIPLKLADGLLPPVFQFMGLWLLACFVLQAVFGTLLVATVTASPLLQLLGAALFALSPVLLNRIGHQALCAHWLLLAALWLYARSVNTTAAPSFGWWIALTAAVALTHPYLTVQVVAVAVAAIVATCGRGKQLRAAAIRLGALAVTVGASWWAAGYFVVRDADSLQETGFGRLSLNLVAPFLPPPGAWLDGRVPLAGLGHEQLEGYSYLGLGGFVLLGVALCVGLALIRRGMWSAGRYVPLVVACVVLTLLAIGPTVTLGTRVLFEYDGSWWGPLGIFRSSGRVFWIVYYAILFAGIAAIVRLPRGWAAGVLATALVLQQIDLAGVQRISKTMRDIRAESPLSHELWTILPPHYRHMVLYPTNMCSPNPGIDYRDLAVLAGSAGATINAGYAGRVDVAQLQAYCRDLEAALARGEVADDSLYVVTPPNVPRLLASSTPVACTPLDPYAVCFTVASYARWREQWDLIRRSVPDSGELAGFLEQLEAEYRDRPGREVSDQVGTIGQRLEALARFIAYRAHGCEYEEALGYAAAATPSGTGLCRQPTFGPRPPAGADEVLRAREALDRSWRQEGRPVTPTYVDPAGEAAWLQAYVSRRVQGQSHAQAMAEVLQAMRSVAS